MRYNILQPVYHKHIDSMGNRVTDTQGNPAWLIQWKVIGQCNSMAEAKLITACPILEQSK
jgi:hypothetical protein